MKDYRGFTLIEILIAVLIFAIIISILFSSFRAFIVSSETLKEEMNYYETIRVVFKRISMDLESLFVLQPPRYQKPEFNSEPDPFRLIGKEETIGQTIVSSLTFISIAHIKFADDPREGLSIISYYLKENTTKRFDLYRSDSLFSFSESLESCSDSILCRDISDFKIVYTDSKGISHDYWDSDSEEFLHMFPKTIEMIIFSNFREERRQFRFSIDLVTARSFID